MGKSYKKSAAELFMNTDEPQEVVRTEQAELAIPKGYKLVKENKSERMQLLVRPNVKTAIKKDAEMQGLSMNDLVNNVLENYLEGKGLI